MTFRFAIAALCLAACSSSPAAPKPLAPPTAAIPDGTSCRGLCTCEAVATNGPWQSSVEQNRKAFAAALPAIAKTCREDQGEDYASVDELRGVIDQCLQRVSSGNVRLAWCKNDQVCCRITLTAHELDGRRWMQMLYPGNADYETAVFEVKNDAPVHVTEWLPWHTSLCNDPEAPDKGPEELRAQWASLSSPTKQFLCYGADR